MYIKRSMQYKIGEPQPQLEGNRDENESLFFFVYKPLMKILYEACYIEIDKKIIEITKKTAKSIIGF